MDFSLVCGLGCCVLVASISARPPIIDDSGIVANFQAKSGEFAEEGSYPAMEKLHKGLKNPSGLPEIPEVAAPKSALDSVFVVGSVYDCGKCDLWHPSGFATAWVMASDGVFCTNYHVIEGFEGGAMTVASWEGEVYPVTEILLADKANDVAIFRAEVEGLTPLPMAAEAAEVGEEISCLSHPNQRFFNHTYGEVARYHFKRTRKTKVPQMSITADYAMGSSGGPILNEKNEVVGMVASTFNIYTPTKNKERKQNLQMVVKNCVPGFVIQELMAEAPKQEQEAQEEEKLPEEKLSEEEPVEEESAEEELEESSPVSASEGE